MTNHVQDKVVLITGAASGFGSLVARMTAELGAQVVAVDVNGEALEQIVADITKAGGTAIGHVADVTVLADMHGAVAQAVANYERLDVLVNNAGVMPLAFFADHAQAANAWDRCIDINIKGVLNGMVAAYDQMIGQARGQIINLSSIYGNFPVVGAGVYGASKAAVDFLSASMRMEAQGRIKVTTVKPTGVPGTNLAGGIVNPEAVVGILGHNAASYGQTMQAYAAGQLPASQTDEDNVEYVVLEPEHLARQIVHVINQPWGVNISDITVRASGDAYIL